MLKLHSQRYKPHVPLHSPVPFLLLYHLLQMRILVLDNGLKVIPFSSNYFWVKLDKDFLYTLFLTPNTQKTQLPCSKIKCHHKPWRWTSCKDKVNITSLQTPQAFRSQCTHWLPRFWAMGENDRGSKVVQHMKFFSKTEESHEHCWESVLRFQEILFYWCVWKIVFNLFGFSPSVVTDSVMWRTTFILSFEM